MFEIINLNGKNINIDISKVTEISKIYHIFEKSMYCFTIIFIDDSMKNICLYYEASNKAFIKNKIESIHQNLVSHSNVSLKDSHETSTATK
mgnify:CR=1 FL=1